MKPLSQTGFIRQRTNITQRLIVSGVRQKRRALEGINEILAARGLYLHPTKGLRAIYPKRSVAALITAEIRSGTRPFSMTRARRELALAARPW